MDYDLIKRTPDIVVIHVSKADFSDPWTAYIGRAVKRGKWDLAASPLANPFKTSNTPYREVIRSRDEVVALYRDMICAPVGCARVPHLSGRQIFRIGVELNRLRDLAQTGPLRLACWCAPKPCHGDVIRDLIIERLSHD